MGKYYDVGMLSLADPSKTDSPLKAIGDGMINVAEYHKKWQLDKIKDKLANNELKISDINADIAEKTKDDKIAMSNLGVEKAEVDLDTAKIDKKSKELNYSLDELYKESERKQALANQKAQENYTKANTYQTNTQTKVLNYNFSNQQNLDNTIRYMHSLGFVSSGDNDKDYANIQGLLLQQIENENDPQKRKELGNYLNTLHQQKDKIYDMWNVGLKQNVDGFGLDGQKNILNYQRDFLKKYKDFGIVSMQQVPIALEGINAELKNIVSDEKYGKDPQLKEREAMLLQTKKDFEKAMSTLNINQQPSANKQNVSDINANTRAKVQREINELQSTITALETFVSQADDRYTWIDTGWVARTPINLSSFADKLGVPFKDLSDATKLENEKKILDALIAQTMGQSGRIKSQIEKINASYPDDPQSFGNNPTKIKEKYKAILKVLKSEQEAIINAYSGAIQPNITNVSKSKNNDEQNTDDSYADI